MLSALTLGIRSFHIADEGLPTIIYVNMLNVNVLMPSRRRISDTPK